MSADQDWLPPLVLFDEYDGNWDRYLEAIYSIFRQDFVLSKPRFPGKRFALKRHPILDGKEATFWHLISEGKQEEDRLPDLRRCERIRWPRSIIEKYSSGPVKTWIQKRKETRIAVALDDFSYVVILADRGEYVLLWTAFTVDHEHTRRKLKKEYDAHAATLKG